MSMLPADEAIVRLKENESRFDDFINADGYTSTEGVEVDGLASVVAGIKNFNSRGAWAAATIYLRRDLVTVAGTWYVAVEDHTSSALFATDSASKWRVHQGITAAELAAADGATKIGRPVGTVETALTALETDIVAVKSQGVNSQPAYIEQHFAGFFGRGMLTAETINVTTEQSIVGDFAAGADIITCTNSAQYTIGGGIVVKHDNGKYENYFLEAISGNNLGIRPLLKYPATATGLAKLERLWYNRAHPGKFYMRMLAQRIASINEYEAAMPNGRRALFTNVSSNPNTVEDTLVAIGSVINYYDASNLGETGVTSPVRFALGRTAYVDTMTVAGNGVETQYFPVKDAGTAVAKVAFMANSTTTSYVMRVFDQNGAVVGELYVPTSGQRVMKIYTVPCDLRAATKIKVRIVSAAVPIAHGYFMVDQIDVFDAPKLTGKVISKKKATIVVLGDSWVAGDLGNTIQREPVTTQLALELPGATIINKGVGGNKIDQELARFDADVTPYNPDYVVLMTGTNESYSPLSGTFIPTGVDAFTNAYRAIANKCAAIGARLVIVGVPALAQTDADVPGFAEWLLNDRAKAYARYTFESQGVAPRSFVSNGATADGTFVRFEDGTMICRKQMVVTTSAALTLAGTNWNFPAQFYDTPQVVATPAVYSTNQLLSTGASGILPASCTIRLISGTNAIAITIDAVAIGRWRA